MKGLLIISLFLAGFFSACRNDTTDRSDTTNTSENDVDAARKEPCLIDRGADTLHDGVERRQRTRQRRWRRIRERCGPGEVVLDLRTVRDADPRGARVVVRVTIEAIHGADVPSP